MVEAFTRVMVDLWGLTRMMAMVMVGLSVKTISLSLINSSETYSKKCTLNKIIKSWMPNI